MTIEGAIGDTGIVFSPPIAFYQTLETNSRDRYVADYVYGYGTVYFFCATIAVFTIGFWALKFSPASLRKATWWRNLVASIRYAAYQNYEIRSLRWTTPSIGLMGLIAVGILFFAGTLPGVWSMVQVDQLTRPVPKSHSHDLRAKAILLAKYQNSRVW